MTNNSAVKQLNTVLGKLQKLNYHIEGNKLETAINNAAYTRDKLQSKEFNVRKFGKKS